MMTRFQRMASVVSVAALLGLGVATVANAAPDPQGQQQEAGAGHHRHHGRGDLVHAALRLDSLTDAQKQQIELLVTSERAAHANVRTARGQLMQAVATGLGAGNVDDRALAPQLQAVESAIQADEPVNRGALEKLHTILTPAQRTELVGRIESRMARMQEHMAQGQQRPDASAGPNGGEHVGPWGRALGLTDAQRTQIKANLASSKPADQSLRTEERAEHQRVLEAFKGSRFVMSEIAPPKDPRLIDEEAGRMVRLAKASAPVLTAEQRTTAAAKLREMATRGVK